jgi:hypothetical protein
MQRLTITMSFHGGRTTAWADVPAIVTLHASVAAEGRWIGTEAPVDTARFEQLFTQTIESEASHLFVATDGKYVAPPLRPAQEIAGEQSEQDEGDDRVSDAEDRTTAEAQQFDLVRAEIIDHAIVGGDHREAASDRQHAQRHDKRRDTQIGDQYAVDRADQ